MHFPDAVVVKGITWCRLWHFFPSFRNCVCLSLQFTYKRHKEHPASQKTLCSYSKGILLPFWTAAHYKQISALHLHSMTWFVLATVILQLQQTLRNYTGKCQPHLSEILMSAYLWHCTLPQDISDQPKNFDSDIPCFPLKRPEITFDLFVRKRAVPTEDASTKIPSKEVSLLFHLCLALTTSWRKWDPQSPFYCCS